MTNLLVFEDSDNHPLNPITACRPIFDVLVGIDTPFEKIKRYFGHLNLSVACRPELKPLLRFKHSDIPINQINVGSPLLLISGRVLMTPSLMVQIQAFPVGQDAMLVYDDSFVVAQIYSLDLLHRLKEIFEEGLPSHMFLIELLRKRCITQKVEYLRMLRTPWDLFDHLSESITNDFDHSHQFGVIKGDVLPFAALYEENKIYVGKYARIEDFVVLDARKGPIYIDEYTVVESGSRLEGPLYIGKHCHIAGARIKTSAIGDWCKLGGEISMSIFQGYANKSHDGFFGHSYVGEWVNVGANSVTSNLKNNYSPVSLTFGEDTFQTEATFLGSLIGDHSKLGIGTHLTTGSVIGVGATLLGTNVHAASVAPFTWGEGGNYSVHRFEKFTETAKRMMARRQQSWTPFHEDFFQRLFSEREGTLS
jgi:UDP-N-acetylglucosamine diphosphorylase / glucose-1-phosphate thymidylyltransferase / UDP-N-acetylgalactosamine diphosphorylase / glucosamine-1-phosphate N-acetyltransferase / galactosamine-1-phosphate N-acetyltransferase